MLAVLYTGVYLSSLSYCAGGRVKPRFDCWASVALSQYELTYRCIKLESSFSGGKKCNKWSNLLLEVVDNAWMLCGKLHEPFPTGDTGKAVQDLLPPLPLCPRRGDAAWCLCMPVPFTEGIYHVLLIFCCENATCSFVW